MKIHYILITLLCLSTQFINSQESLDELLKRYNNNEVPYISVEELAMPKLEVIILDARETNEYEVSHLKGAICVGYDHFQLKTVTAKIPNKHQPIVVYCSLGIRSEVVANKLKKAGYTNVKNLYGGIFEWKNKAYTVFNSEEKSTDSIHTFSKAWSKWLNNGIKVYTKDKATDD
ncbi:rhodanese-like domain-containing protein [Psychroserpens sp. MEBiC05023]